MAFGSQLGQALGQLAGEVLTSSDIGLPLGPEGTAALLPGAVARFTEGLDRPASEVLVFLAAREAAHHRLFGHVPWLRQRLLATVEEFAPRHHHRHLADRGARPRPRPVNPAAIEQAMSSAVSSSRRPRRAQKAALDRLETLLALVEGWVDARRRAGGRRAAARRGRAAREHAPPPRLRRSGRADLRHPRRARAAAPPAARRRRAVAARSARQRGVDGRDAVWAHPDLLPDRRGPRRPGRLRPRPLGDPRGATPGRRRSATSTTRSPASRQEMRAEKESGTSAPDEGTAPRAVRRRRTGPDPTRTRASRRTDVGRTQPGLITGTPGRRDALRTCLRCLRGRALSPGVVPSASPPISRPAPADRPSR